MLNFFREHKYVTGTISIMLSLLLLPLYSVISVILEGARYRNAQEQLSELNAMGTFAILADYCDYLQKNYGLLGFDSTSVMGNIDLDLAFKDYVENRTATGSISTLPMNKYFGLDIENCEVGCMYSLADPDVLKEQIIQYGKYSMPATYLTDLTLGSLLKSIQDKLKKVNKSLDQINTSLELVNNLRDTANAEMLKAIIQKLEKDNNDYQVLYEKESKIFEENINALKSNTEQMNLLMGIYDLDTEKYNDAMEAVLEDSPRIYSDIDKLINGLDEFRIQLESNKDDIKNKYFKKSEDDDDDEKITISSYDGAEIELTYADAVDFFNELANDVYHIDKIKMSYIDMDNETKYEELIDMVKKYLAWLKNCKEAHERYDKIKSSWEAIQKDSKELIAYYDAYLQAYDKFNVSLKEISKAMKATVKAIDDVREMDSRDVKYYEDDGNFIKCKESTTEYTSELTGETYKIQELEVEGSYTEEQLLSKYKYSPDAKDTSIATQVISKDLANYHIKYKRYINSMERMYYSTDKDNKPFATLFAEGSSIEENVKKIQEFSVNRYEYKVNVVCASTNYDKAYDKGLEKLKAELESAYKSERELYKEIINQNDVSYFLEKMDENKFIDFNMGDKIQNIHKTANRDEVVDFVKIYGSNGHSDDPSDAYEYNEAKYMSLNTIHMIDIEFLVTTAVDTKGSKSNIFKAISDVCSMVMNITPVDWSCNATITIDNTYPSKQTAKDYGDDPLPSEDIKAYVNSSIRDYNSQITSSGLYNRYTYDTSDEEYKETLFEQGAKKFNDGRDKVINAFDDLSIIKVKDGKVTIKLPSFWKLIKDIVDLVEGVCELIEGFCKMIAGLIEIVGEIITNGFKFLMDSLYINYYATAFFHNRLDADPAVNIAYNMMNFGDEKYSFVSCESEYVITGNGNEKAAQAEVWYLIFAFRCVVNFYTISTNSTLMGALNALTPIIAVPGLVICVLVESYMDMAFLMNGSKVAILKSDPYILDWKEFKGEVEEILKSYKNSKSLNAHHKDKDTISSDIGKARQTYIMRHSRTAKVEKDGSLSDQFSITYENYLYIMMLFMGNETKVKRIGDLIQMNMRDSQADSSIKLSDYKTYIYTDITARYSSLMPMLSTDTPVGEIGKIRSVQFNGY